MRIEEIVEILGRFRKRDEEKLLSDIPATVREKVGGLLSDWTRHFSLAVPAEAWTSLQARVAELVQKCMEALSRASDGDGGTGG